MTIINVNNPSFAPGSTSTNTPGSGVDENLFHVGLDSQDHELSKKIKNAQHLMLSEGKQNGAKGIYIEPTEVQDLAKAISAQIHYETKALISKRTKEIEENISNKNEEYERAKGEVNTVNDQYKQLVFTSYYSSNNHNWLSIILLSLFGAFLILADIPLAVQLIQVGFNFPEQTKDLHPDNLFLGSFWHILQANWQVFLTALGISFCTIIIKLVYDEYVASPYGSAVLKRKKFYEIFEPAIDPQQTQYFNEKERKMVAWEQLSKNLVKLTILSLTFYMIIILGQFRVASLQIVDIDREYNAKELDAHDRLKNDPEAKGQLLKQLIAQREEAKKERKKESGNIFPLTFSLLTLMFPVASGICFSMAFAALHNKARLKQIKRVQTEKNEKAKVISDEMAELKGKQIIWQNDEIYFKDGGWVDLFTQKLVQLYKYGFKIGRIRPDLVYKIPDIITIIQNWQNKNVIYRTNHQLQFNNKHEAPPPPKPGNNNDDPSTDSNPKSAV